MHSFRILYSCIIATFWGSSEISAGRESKTAAPEEVIELRYSHEASWAVYELSKLNPVSPFGNIRFERVRKDGLVVISHKYRGVDTVENLVRFPGGYPTGYKYPAGYVFVVESDYDKQTATLKEMRMGTTNEGLKAEASKEANAKDKD